MPKRGISVERALSGLTGRGALFSAAVGFVHCVGRVAACVDRAGSGVVQLSLLGSGHRCVGS